MRRRGRLGHDHGDVLEPAVAICRYCLTECEQFREEVGVNLLKIYDATDLAMPILLGVWHQNEGAGPVASQHNLQIVDEHLYVAHYANGIFVFDLKKIAEQDTPITSDIEPVARYHPQSTSFWDVVLEDGLVYTGKFSSGGGFDVVGFGCIRAGDPALSSTG